MYPLARLPRLAAFTLPKHNALAQGFFRLVPHYSRRVRGSFLIWRFDRFSVNLGLTQSWQRAPNPDIIQELVSISDYGDHFYLHLVESAPFNLGKRKLYAGVPGNLFAFTCKLSWDKGYEGFESFQSKTKLIEHYESSLGATHVGGHKMVIFPPAALNLIKQYFQI